MKSFFPWFLEILTNLILLSLGLRFLITWYHPYALGPNAVSHHTWLIIFAFFQIFFNFMAGGLMVLREGRNDWIAFFTIFVTAAFLLALAASIAWESHQQGAFYDLLLLISTQMARHFWGPLPSEREKIFTTVNVVSMVVLYIFFMVSPDFLSIPRLGLTPQVTAQLPLPPNAGDFHKNPHWAMFAGTCYFSSLALIRIVAMTIIFTRRQINDLH
jgi:hypothetical protein